MTLAGPTVPTIEDLARPSLNKKLTMAREKQFNVPQAFVIDKLREDENTREEKLRQMMDQRAL